MALLLCLMLLLQHSQGPSLDSALPLINNNNITNNGPYTIDQSTTPLPSNVDNNDTTNDGPSIINKTIELDKGRDVFTNERHSPTPLPVPSQPMGPSFTDAFRPSLTVIVGLLSSMLGLSFLVLLYAKHCKRIPMSVYEEERDMPSLRYHLNYYHHYEARGAGGSSGRAPDNARTDSGISPYVVESLPTFPFSALKGMKDGLECAVCLSRYDNADVLRLLPTCKHAFHLACIDLWLLHHSTCPLCRRRVDNDNENDHDLGSISISHSQELEDFLSRYKLWGGRSHEDSDSARIPSSAWEHWGQISEVGGQSARVSAPPGEPSAWSRIGVPAQHSSLVAGDSARTLESGVNWTHMSAPAPPRSLAPVPIMMGGDGQLLPGVSTLDSNSSRFSKLGRHSSRALLRSAATHSARALGPGGQLARVPASQCTDIPMVEMPTLEFYLQREVEGVDDDGDENNGGVSIWCNGGSNSWRKLDDNGVCAEGGSAKKNHMDDGHNDRALVEGLGKVPKEGSMQRWVVTKGMVMMRRRRMNESWRKGGDKYYDEEVMKRLRHRINIIPHFSSHTIHHHHHHDTHCNDDDDDDDDDDGCHDTLTMGHHHYGHDIKPCTRNATTRCFSEISCRDQIGSL